MRQPRFPFYFFPGSILATFMASHVAVAQILPDNTLPNNSTVTLQENLIKIENGTKLGTHLFHSFEQFSVPEGNTAFFNNALDIQNIFSRVTGGTISNIDGLIEANGSANLFLINPNGIIFGKDASLNIGGSFISSTAERIIFTDGSEFNATNPQSQPLLTISAPIGLGFGSIPGTIVNQSLATDPIGEFFVGLSVPVGETLALVGGDVLIEGGILTAPEGRVELGSVAENQTVSLTEIESGWQLGYENVQAFQDITLSDFAFVDTSGARGGAIQIQGRNIDVISDSFIVSSTFGTETGETLKMVASDSINMSGDLTGIQTESFGTGAAGDIEITTQNLTIRDGAFIGIFGEEEAQTGNFTLKALESIELAGTTSDVFFNSGIFVTVANNPSTEVNTLSIDTKNLIMRDGASVSTINLGGNQPLDLRVNATESIELLGASADGNFISGVFAVVEEGGMGDGGNLTVDTTRLSLAGGAQISTITLGNGSAGDLTVKVAESIQLKGVEPNDNNPSGIFASTEASSTGNGGNLSIETGQLIVRQGAQISTTTFGIGNAGILNVRASESIQLEGRDSNGETPSGLFAQVEIGATGDGGELIVETPRLILLEGAQISTAARSEGKGGDIILDVSDSILLSGSAADPRGFPFGSSAILVSAQPGSTNDAGTLNLTTSELTVEKGGRISANNFGTGAGGNATLNVNSLIIQGGGEIGAGSLLEPGATDNERGDGGELTVKAAESIEIIGTGTIGTTEVNSSLFTRTEGTGNAGDLNIFTPNLTVGNGGEINVSTLSSGAGGTLTINGNRLLIQDNGIVSASTSTTGEAGSIEVTGNDLEITNGGRLLSTTAGEAKAGNINVRVLDELTLTGSESGFFANAEADSSGQGGNINVDAVSGNVLITDGAAIAVNSQGSGEAGTVELQANSLTLDQGIITAETGSNQGGNINLTVEKLLQLSNESKITATAGTIGAGGDGGNIDIRTEFLIAQPDGSEITAEAFEGNGGNINIALNSLLGERFLDISASSRFGLDGSINIDFLDQDRTQSLIQLPNNPLDAEDRLTDACSPNQQRRAKFIATGKGGLPPTPTSLPTGTLLLSDLGPLVNQAQATRLQEAQGWNIAANGKITLVTSNLESLLSEGGKAYHNSDYSQAVNLWHQAAEILEQENNSISYASIMSNLALAYSHLGDWQKAQSAIAISQKLLTPEIISNHPWLSAQVLNTKGSLQFAQGNPKAALNYWQQAVKIHEQNSLGQIQTRLNQTQAWQALGFYRQAQNELNSIAAVLAEQPDSSIKAITLLNLGNIGHLDGDTVQSQQLLQEALSISKSLNQTKITSKILLNLGHIARISSNPDQALSYYQQASTLDPTILGQFQTQISQLDLLLAQQKYQLAKSLWLKLQNQMDKLPVSHESIYTQLHLAQSLLQTEYFLISPQQIMTLLVKADRQAKIIKDKLSQAYILGYQGKIYGQTRQWQEAETLTKQALMIAQALESPELSYQLFWQLGRFYIAQGNKTKAIAAYTEAVNTLGTLRGELVAASSDVQYTFRDRVEPVYRELVKLLLDQDSGQTIPQANLEKARSLIEDLQLAQLHDYFQDACIKANPIAVDQVEPTAAIIYPILLDDRLDVIVSIAGELMVHHSTSISSEQVEQTVNQLLRSLTTPLEAIQGSTTQQLQRVYNWIIAPIAPQLEQQSIETLVFVADGILRTLPLAALHDGQQYLIENYNVALSPGLDLLDPRPLQRDNLRLLAGGLSEARPGFSPLPFVSNELEQITNQIPDHQLLFNQELTRENLNADLAASSTEVIHLATHGEFGSSAAETFVLTWEGKMTINEMAQVLQSRSQSNTSPIELLVLSACKTATGDSRAVLGIAGMTIRSGARSTIAGLWSLNDQAVAKFMSHFYQALSEPNTTKAEAFRQAQLTLLTKPEFQSPYYWSPFVLVGNWL